MIEFTPSDEQKMLRDSIHRFAENDIRKAAHEADEHSATPPEVVAKGWELGILPGLIPEEYGGYADGQSAITGALALEEVAWGDLSVALNIWTPSLFALPILMSGTAEQKQQFLPRFCDTQRPIMTAAVIEASVMFDVWKPSVTITKKQSKVTLDGEKTYVPLATEAEAMIVYGRDSQTGQVDGYIVERETSGLEVCERNQLMGIRALPTYRIKLSGVTVSPDQRIGGEKGTEFARIINRSRIALGAMAVGVARAAFEYARDYARERVQFGVPIASKQAIAFRLADMAIEVDAARLLVWEAAWQADQGNDSTQSAAVLKQHIARMALFVTDSAVQILGGHGYIREHPVERWLRNARGFSTFDGLAMV